ncbi:type VI immunity family protein [Archangium primigenium]|uniref:type VI immunity family protein n=1 Tax=[Archangium] primigenium TaxID=2792470 RepID=UPI0019585603|nr:type VI immunity family protein [Archangium primigenium]MBM7112923.1 DUF3396 domain-containing protein [Archangium primigenium]
MNPIPQIRCHAKNGALVVREGVSICFYLRQHHRDLRPAILQSLDTYLRAVGHGSLGWYTDAEGDWQELDPTGWAAVHQELDQDTAFLHLTDTPNGASQYAVDYRGMEVHDTDAVCALCFWLPTEQLVQRGAPWLRALALALAAPLPFNSGHAGLAFSALTQLAGVSSTLRPWCFQHPGMDVPDPGGLAHRLGTRVPGVHWLTFLGPPVLGELGGASGLRARLVSPDISVHELDPQRVLLTLGAEPDAGDTSVGHHLPLHREVARLLEPWLFHRPLPWGGFSPEDLRRWERRFLD